MCVAHEKILIQATKLFEMTKTTRNDTWSKASVKLPVIGRKYELRESKIKVPSIFSADYVDTMMVITSVAHNVSVKLLDHSYVSHCILKSVIIV